TGTVTATAANMAPNADAVFSLMVKVDLNTADQTILSDTATASTTATDAISANNSATATTLTSNQAPVITVPPAQMTNENVPLTFSTAVGNAIRVGDAEAGSTPLSLIIKVGQGTLVLGSTAGLTSNSAGNAGNTSISLSGPLTALNNALNGLIFTPNTNYSGPDALTLALSDGSTTTTRSVPITVNFVDTPPVAANGSVTTQEDTATAITLKATDADNQTLTYIVVTPPAHGTLSGSGANLTYTPNANYNGTDSFTFKANDGMLDSNIATINISVTPVNDAPVAQDDAYSSTGLQPLTVAAPGVLANDTDIDGNALHAVVVSQPTHGTLAFNADGSFTYAPAIGFNGTDSFTYKANDGAADSNIATVTLNIGGNPGQSVTLGLSNSSVSEGTPVTGTLTLSRPSATDVSVALLSSQTSVATVPASLTIPAGQTGGTFTISTLKNPLATGAQQVAINVNAGDYGTSSANLTVTDNETPTLTLTVVPNAINENYGPAAALATLTRNTPTAQALPVALLNSNLKALKVPASVVIPAGAASVTFFVAALDNRIINKVQTALLTARATSFKDGTAKLTIADNGKVTRDLKLSLTSGTTYIEQAGGQTVTGTITLSGIPLTKNLTITLVSSDPKRLVAPASVLLKAGQAKVNFSFRVLDNTVADGSHQVWLTARSLGFGTSAVQVTILDNDGPALSLSLPKTSVAENAGSLTATVTRLHVPTTAALAVSLASSDKTRVTVPATVTIPAKAASVTLKVTVINNKVVDGNHLITLTAAKSGFLAGTTKLTVLDDDKAPVTTPRSTAGLSTATVSAANGIQLHFTGALDAESASDAAHYAVTVNGQAVTVESAGYNAATHTVMLGLANGSVQAGDRVSVQWNGVLDARGAAVIGQAGPLATR
ncbi:MAG: tandem-95 repeat protein, partial [Abitibacteriaceae bacterium]|nr:tandem-95 repeat protein [Abditibacteriaceae bacterium]